MKTVLLLLPALALTACEDDKGTARRHGNPGEDFTWDDAVRIVSPTNGETVSTTFTLEYTAGADIDSLQVMVDGNRFESLTALGEGSVVVTLSTGRHGIKLVGMDAGGNELSEHEIGLRVEDTDPWVTITSPPDGGEVPNPVTFAVNASDDVDTIELKVDDWVLGTVEPGGILTYEFDGTGYARSIEADAYADGVLVATDTITVTVDAGTAPSESDFTDVVVAFLESYPTDGSYGYYWPSDSDWSGTTRDIWYLDTLVAEGDAEHRSYCVGLTWEVFMRSWEQIDEETGGDGTINGMSVDDLTEFRIDWFVRDLWGAGPLDAMDNYGIGDRVTDWSQVRKGDFVQFWRHSGSGHDVIFIDWETDSEGDITGFTYWSTQSSTDGIGYNSEYFGSSGSSIDPAFFFVSRPRMPENWEPWF